MLFIRGVDLGLHCTVLCTSRVFIKNCSSRRIVESSRRVFGTSEGRSPLEGGGSGGMLPREVLEF